MPRPFIPCPPEIAPFLGTEHDHQTAHRAGVSKMVVRRWRREAQVGPLRGPIPPLRAPIDTSSRGTMLTPEATQRVLDALPGTGWADLARRIGVSKQAVAWALQHGATRETLKNWSDRARSAVPVPVPPLPWAPSEVARMGLGVEPDDVIAARENVSMALVASWRRKAGLTSPTRGAPKMSPADTAAALDAEQARLGCRYAADLAAKMGLTPGTISNWRTRGVNPATLRRFVARAESLAPNLDREDS